MRVTKTLLVIGQAVYPTGYARVIDNVLHHLSNAYKIHHFGLNYRGEPITGAWTIHPNRLPGDIHGLKQVSGLIRELKPDFLWIVHDIYLYLLLRKVIPWNSWTGKVAAYFPIENKIEKAFKLKGIEGLHCLVLYNEYARREVTRACSEIGAHQANFQCPPLKVIGNGVDREKFYPCVSDPSKNGRANRVYARSKLFPDRPELADAFIVLNANRNSRRKRIDLTLRAFAKFAKDKPGNVYLYLHMGMRDSGYDILDIARKLGIEKRLLLTTEHNEMPHIQDELLNLVYNACDVGLNTSTGEGWGLVAFEHAATAAAQVMPAHGTCLELWEGAAALVEPVNYTKEDFDFVAWRNVNPMEIAGILDELYHNPDLLRDLSLRAYQRVQSKALSWKVIASQWDNLFRSLLAN